MLRSAAGRSPTANPATANSQTRLLDDARSVGASPACVKCLGIRVSGTSAVESASIWDPHSTGDDDAMAALLAGF